MDCDLQDPPEEIPRLYAKAIGGYEIVVAQFEERAESTLRQKTSRSVLMTSGPWILTQVENPRTLSRNQ
jgi:hypothetical protein